MNACISQDKYVPMLTWSFLGTQSYKFHSTVVKLYIVLVLAYGWKITWYCFCGFYFLSHAFNAVVTHLEWLNKHIAISPHYGIFQYKQLPFKPIEYRGIQGVHPPYSIVDIWRSSQVPSSVFMASNLTDHQGYVHTRPFRFHIYISTFLRWQSYFVYYTKNNMLFIFFIRFTYLGSATTNVMTKIRQSSKISLYDPNKRVLHFFRHIA